jgi:hypothetical protein
MTEVPASQMAVCPRPYRKYGVLPVSEDRENTFTRSPLQR